jgi:hypothetical protein
MGLGLIGGFFILIALIGGIAHGQTPGTTFVPNGTKCVVTDPKGELYIAAICITNHTTRAQMCSDLRSGLNPNVNFSQDATDVLCNGISITDSDTTTTPAAAAPTHSSGSTSHHKTHHHSGSPTAELPNDDRVHVDTSGHSSNGKNQLVTEHPNGSVTSSDTGTDNQDDSG